MEICWCDVCDLHGTKDVLVYQFLTPLTGCTMSSYPSQEFIRAIKNPEYMYAAQRSRYFEVAALIKFLGKTITWNMHIYNSISLGVHSQGEIKLLTKLSHYISIEKLRDLARKAASQYGEIEVVDRTRPRSPFSCFIYIAIRDSDIPVSSRVSVFGRKARKYQ